jgi:hypothetical protein
MLIVSVEILASLTVVIGALFATVAWITVLVALQDGTRSKAPTALYTFTACIVIDIVGLIGIWLFAGPQMRQASVFGVDPSWLAADGFLASSVICLVPTILLLLKDAGPGKFIIMSGAIVLLGIAALGLASALTG